MHPPVPPSTSLRAFNCPHCAAYAAQAWFEVGITPALLPETHQQLLTELHISNTGSDNPRARLIKLGFTMLAEGMPYTLNTASSAKMSMLNNCNLSQCAVCSKLAIWINRSLVFPPLKNAPLPNNDLSADIKRDFEEARAIVNYSPRGAAALLRLCIQKLCIQLGGNGNIDKDIKDLVSKGLNVNVQQALDVVRVIGNECVHPGTMDMTDDHSTATTLFSLVNFIADKMISEPNAIAVLYGTLPPAKVKAIEERDAKKPA